MSRPLRISYKNAYYHITSRGHRKEKIFYDDKDKRIFIRKLDETFQKYSITCYAYCLMDNHYHLFIKTKKSQDKGVKSLLLTILFFDNVSGIYIGSIIEKQHSSIE